MIKAITQDGLQFDPRSASIDEFNQFNLIDIRDPMAAAMTPIDFLPCERIPLQEFNFGIPESLDPAKPYLVCCYHGNDSQMLTRMMRAAGFDQVYSVVGGYDLLQNLKLQGQL